MLPRHPWARFSSDATVLQTSQSLRLITICRHMLFLERGNHTVYTMHVLNLSGQCNITHQSNVSVLAGNHNNSCGHPCTDDVFLGPGEGQCLDLWLQVFFKCRQGGEVTPGHYMVVVHLANELCPIGLQER